MAHATISKEYQHWAFVVDEQELRRLCAECRSAFAETGTTAVNFHFKVRFSDGLDLATDSLDELLSEENPRLRAITGLELSASDEGGRITARVGLDSEKSSRLDVRGNNRQWVYVTFSRIEDRLKRMRAYPRPYFFVALSVIAGFFFMNWINKLLLSKYATLLSVHDPSGKAENSWAGQAVGLSLFLTFVIALPYCVSKLFPHPVFLIGDGVKRHDRLASLRSKLFWSVGVSAGLAALVRSVRILLW